MQRGRIAEEFKDPFAHLLVFTEESHSSTFITEIQEIRDVETLPEEIIPEATTFLIHLVHHI